MATEKNTTKQKPRSLTNLEMLTTECHSFCEIPVYNAHLMYVPKLLSPELASSASLVAWALESAVHAQLEQATDAGIDKNQCYLLAFALEGAAALRQAVESSPDLGRREA